MPLHEITLSDAILDAMTGLRAEIIMLSQMSSSHVGCGRAQFRQALSRPMPAERDYLEAQFTGVGVLVAQQQAG